MTESLDESGKLYKGFIFLGSITFMDLFFGGPILLGVYFLDSTKISGPSPPPCHIRHIFPGGLSTHFWRKGQIVKMAKKLGKWDKHGHYFVIEGQATGQTRHHTSAYITMSCG